MHFQEVAKGGVEMGKRWAALGEGLMDRTRRLDRMGHAWDGTECGCPTLCRRSPDVSGLLVCPAAFHGSAPGFLEGQDHILCNGSS